MMWNGGITVATVVLELSQSLTPLQSGPNEKGDSLVLQREGRGRGWGLGVGGVVGGWVGCLGAGVCLKQ